MARPRSVVPKKQVLIQLPEKYIQALDVIDQDPFTSKRIYGARNDHIQKALHNYLENVYPGLLARLEKEQEANVAGQQQQG